MILSVFVVLLAAPSGADDPASPDVAQAMTRGVEFLVRDQNADGSWGGAHNAVTTWSGPVWSNPETHHAWKVATTGLCVAALLEVDVSASGSSAALRGIEYLVVHSDVRRPSEWDTMNNWAYIYGLQGLAVAHRHPVLADAVGLKSRVAETITIYLRNLGRFQSLNGGYGYLEFDEPRTRQPQWATSFMTAAAVIAMAEARAAGFEVDDRILGRAVRCVQHCRLPNGGYSYNVRTVPNLNSEYIDQIKGSLSRIAVCQEALMLGGVDIAIEDRRFGLRHFFRHHKFLDIAVAKPVPHETYYFNSGYFYMFGHYYTARVIAGLTEEDQGIYWPKLRHEVLKMQQADGSMWDYDMHRYDKPYGVAFGLMALHHSVDRPVNDE